RGDVDAGTDLLGERDQQLPLRSINHQERRAGDAFTGRGRGGGAGWPARSGQKLHVANNPQSARGVLRCAVLPHLAAGKVGDVVSAWGTRYPSGGWSLPLGPRQ